MSHKLRPLSRLGKEGWVRVRVSKRARVCICMHAHTNHCMQHVTTCK